MRKMFETVYYRRAFPNIVHPCLKGELSVL